MSGETIQVRGYREAASALNRVNQGSKKALYAGLREAAKPIAEDTKQRLSEYQGISLGTIGPRVTQRGVYVTQRAGKVTGLRPDFGALQMTEGFLPALAAGANSIEADVTAAYEALIRIEGF